MSDLLFNFIQYKLLIPLSHHPFFLYNYNPFSSNILFLLISPHYPLSFCDNWIKKGGGGRAFFYILIKKKK